MDEKKVVQLLNQALAQEHGCQVRYRTHAAVITGPYAESVASRLKEIAEDEKAHADTLRDRITALGGTPTMDVAKDELIPATTLKKIIEINIAEEKKAIAMYRSVLKILEHDNVILYEAIEHIIEDEQEHLEELERLQE
jgi:bacterioferritin